MPPLGNSFFSLKCSIYFGKLIVTKNWNHWFSPEVQLNEPEMEYGKPDDDIAELDDVYQTNKRAAATPDETDTVQLDYDSQEKLVCKREPYNVCYRINLDNREIVPADQVRSNMKESNILETLL